MFRAEAGQPMNPGARRFVWALASLSLWLEQIRRSGFEPDGSR